MFWWKRSVGWLSVLSLLSALFFTSYSLYLVITPFFNYVGMEVHILPSPNQTMASTILNRSGRFSQADTLRIITFMNQEVKPESVLRGWDAFGWSLDRFMRTGSVPQLTSRTNVAAAALVDGKGRIVAAWPERLIGSTVPITFPLANLKDSEFRDYGNQSVADAYYSWTSKLRDLVQLHTSADIGDLILTKITTPDGGSTGVMVTVPKSELSGLVGEWPVMHPSPVQTGTMAAASLFLFLITMPLWVALDAAWRGMRPVAWGLLVLLTGVIGLIAYLIARLPAPGKCPNCRGEVLAKFVRCPSCGTSLPSKCPICRTNLKPGWQYCPKCSGTPLESSQLVAAPPVIEEKPVETADTPTLKVSAVDAESGRPLAGAIVGIKGPSVINGLMNNSGEFTAKRLRSGDYTVTVTKNGYEAAQTEVTVGESSKEQTQLRAKALPGSIGGQVLERSSRNPVSGANIYLDTTRIDRSAVSDIEGSFKIGDIPAGPYTVCADAEGLDPQSRLVELSPGQQATVEFTLDRQADPEHTSALEGEIR